MKYVINMHNGVNDYEYYDGIKVKLYGEWYASTNMKELAKVFDTYEDAETALKNLKQTCTYASSAQIEEVEE